MLHVDSTLKPFILVTRENHNRQHALQQTASICTYSGHMQKCWCFYEGDKYPSTCKKTSLNAQSTHCCIACNYLLPCEAVVWSCFFTSEKVTLIGDFFCNAMRNNRRSTKRTESCHTEPVLIRSHGDIHAVPELLCGCIRRFTV